MTRTVYLNGEFIPEEQAQVSVFDRGFTHGDGLFETLRVRNGKPFRLEMHYARWTESAKEIFLKIPIECKPLERILQVLVEANGLRDAMVRIQLTRGPFHTGLELISDQQPTLVISAKPFVPAPEEWITQGIKIGILPDSAVKTGILDRQIKSSSYLSNLMARHWAQEHGCQEAILTTETGALSEGATSNIFIVKNNTLVTPSLNPYILAGVTRRVVLECASSLNIDFKEQSVALKDILEAEEAFITNSRIGIVPIRKIHGQDKIFSIPGKVTHALREAYLKIVEAEC